MPIETRVTCTLFVTGDGDYCDTLRLHVTVGELRSIDPTPDGPREPALYWAYDDADSGYSQAPTFEWLDIAGVGTRLAITSDDQTVQFDLPTAFGPFYFYGRRFTQFSVCGNGWVGPGYTTRTAYSNARLPSASEATMLALAWDDLYPPTSGGVWWHHDASNHRLIIQYDSMPYYSNRTAFEWFQVVIYDTTLAAPDGNSVFTYQYLTANNYGSTTVGINDSTTAIGIQCLLDGAYHRGSARIEPGRAIRFTTTGPTVAVADERPTRPGVREFDLRASPSPSRGRTTLAFELPAPAPVTLVVFDVSGREIRTIAAGPLAAGRHLATWDGRDEDGVAVPNGSYLCRLETPQGAAVTRTTLVR
ncbi:MAG: FlgD immunoglobulin-like domain containing protein [bacterium]